MKRDYVAPKRKTKFLSLQQDFDDLSRVAVVNSNLKWILSHIQFEFNSRCKTYWRDVRRLD